jgi:hypothetical protein
MESVILGDPVLIATTIDMKKPSADNRVRLGRGTAIKLNAIRRFFGLESLSEAVAQSTAIYSDRLAIQDPDYAKVLAEEARAAESLAMEEADQSAD